MWRVHIHHIKHWAVYKSHESTEMIAVCPSCHDAVHHGRLEITDETLYSWKGINRSAEAKHAHIYVEPADDLKVFTGTISLATTNDQMVVFELANGNHLKLRVLDRCILQVSARLRDLRGEEILRVVENHVRVVKDKSINFDFRPGRVRITVPVASRFAPKWLIEQVKVQVPDYAMDGQIVALDAEVLEPGVIRVQGCWPDADVGFVITEDRLSFCRRGQREPTSLVGGEGTTLVYTGPISAAFFGFA